MSNHIPPMTDEQGRSWPQPTPDQILITDTHAVMPEEAFNLLYEYSKSRPSGVYPGKMWRHQEDGDWYLCWYGEVPDKPSHCSNNHRLIQIFDWQAMMGIQGN